jgi:protein-S-isoprenylcysteine O-methyltransferase Ste14
LIKLDLKIPPALVMLLIALIMWLVSHITPDFNSTNTIINFAYIPFVLIGAFFIIFGIIQFRYSGTTFNPMQPEAASALVTTGIYKVTRNPMYLGILLILIGWGLFLSNLFSCLVTILFILYMNRYQIKPEEKTLELLFGESFIDYKSQVRRWL